MSNIVSIDRYDLNIASFRNKEESEQNLLETGELSYFFEKLNEIEDTDEKITLLFENLSRIMSMQGQYKWKCESALKEQIYSISMVYPTDVKNLIELPEYKFNPQFSEIINKIRYLVKNRLVGDRDSWFLWETKFSHHLEKTLGNLHTMSKGAAYLTSGVAIFIAGLNKFYPDDTTKKPNQEVGVTALVAGIGLIAAPFIGAFRSSGTNNP